jgi:hypothetical protein
VLTWTHIHLMLNHIPVIGVAVPITLLLTDWVRKSRKLEWLSLQMFVVFALLTIPVYLTGSPAHRQMRTMPEISQDAIQRHCNAADFAFWTMEGLGRIFAFRTLQVPKLGNPPSTAHSRLARGCVADFGIDDLGGQFGRKNSAF